MKLDTERKSHLREIGEKNQVSFSTVLLAYIMEGFFQQLSVSSYNNVLLLANPEQIGKKAYQTIKTVKLVFYYMESERKIAQDSLIPGQKLSKELGEEMTKELFPKKNRMEIEWKCSKLKYQEGLLHISMVGIMDEMKVPMEFKIYRLKQPASISRKLELDCLVQTNKPIRICIFPAEQICIQNLIEIMEKLELIADMKPYDAVNQILQTQTISGHRVLEAFKKRAEEQSSFQNSRRFQQLKKYKDYAYMRKRWERYRNPKEKLEDWETVLQRIVTFLEPVWEAFCENQVFLDDWMPELGRFLG